MMQGDDIRDQRMKAEQDAKVEQDAAWVKPLTSVLQDDPNYHLSRGVLALWVIAERLLEVRSLFGIIVEHTIQPAADGYVEGEDNDCQPPKGEK
jgi:hypothetical protein